MCSGRSPASSAAIQALEAIKVITGTGQPLYDRLLQFDGAELSFREVEVGRAPTCPVCGEQPTITELRDEEVM